ncbi:MAG: TonB-dependent receptor [Candidatus Eisenbacteria bacterium]
MSFRPYSLRPWFAFALTLVMAASVHAGTTGKIAGVVRDGSSGLPLPAANVTVIGTTMGAASNDEGEYFILNVPAGTYSVQAMVIGYKPLLINDVLVAADFTADINFQLEPTVALQVEAVEVKAEKPLIQRDQTSAVRIVESEDIEKLPIRGYQDAAGLQAGVASFATSVAGEESTNGSRLYIRGGRSNEVAFFVDGFSQQDPLTGISSTNINQDAINQVVVLTGGFDAEYGKIMSGVVNVVTKDAAAEYTGSVEAVSDVFASAFGSEVYDYNIYSGSFGGPLLPGNDKLSFYVSGERRWQADRSPRPIANLDLTADQDALFGDDLRLPNNHLSGYSWQGKLNYSLARNMKVKIGTLGSQDDWQEYRHAYLFDANHTPRYEDENNSVFGSFTHTVNSKFFYDASVNWFKTYRFRGDGVYFKDIYAYGRDVNPQYDQDLPLFFYGDDSEQGAHVWDDYLIRDSEYVGFRGNGTYAWSDQNTAKSGFEYRSHTLRKYNHLFPIQSDDLERGFIDVDGYGYSFDGQDEVDSGLDGKKTPKDFSLYLQNLYETDDFVLRTGLRYDYLDTNTKGLKDDANPLGADGATLDDEDLVDAKSYSKVSPRLGIAFPIGERTQFHMNYGKFFQQPNLEDLYVSYKFLEHKVKTGGYFYPFGNPNLKPEETTSYEFAVNKQVGDNAAFKVGVFYKDVKNLVQVVNISANPNSYSSYRNTDYGTVKGFDVQYDYQGTDRLSGSLFYTLSWARGTGSASNTQRNIAWTDDQPPKLTSPLDFDQRHILTANVDYRFGEADGPALGEHFPLANAGVNVVFNASSGKPFTPRKVFDEVTLASVSAENAGAINELTGPWNVRVDLKANKGFELGGFDLNAFVWVLNVFDKRNAIFVYESSGDALSTTFLDEVEGGASYSNPEDQALYRLKERNPNNFDVPRLVRFGLRLGF